MLAFVDRTLVSDIPAVLVLVLTTPEVWAFLRAGCGGRTKCLFPLIAFALRYLPRVAKMSATAISPVRGEELRGTGERNERRFMNFFMREPSA